MPEVYQNLSTKTRSQRLDGGHLRFRPINCSRKFTRYFFDELMYDVFRLRNRYYTQNFDVFRYNYMRTFLEIQGSDGKIINQMFIVKPRTTLPLTKLNNLLSIPFIGASYEKCFPRMYVQNTAL